jgi:hypothetical protein
MSGYHRIKFGRNLFFLITQILCLADQIDFTQRCEAALQRGASQSLQALKELFAEQKQQLKEYTSVDMEGQHVLQLKIKVCRLIQFLLKRFDCRGLCSFGQALHKIFSI